LPENIKKRKLEEDFEDKEQEILKTCKNSERANKMMRQ
jgi:hypothetical protein